MPKGNRLGLEKSPYLLQHKDNPVNWYAWGPEAFQAARNEDKPIFLSIGYSTCHWCHVMEHDSFEREEVASLLNQHFISIKVDREERPDVDQVYMDAVVSLTGRGGWPMTVFLTPDLKPFFGGTFFWKEQFIQLLQRIQTGWQENRQQIVEAGNELVAHVRQKDESGHSNLPDEVVFKKAFQQFEMSFDPYHGGFGSAPKFPRSVDLGLLLRMYRRTGHQQLKTMVEKTLDAMAQGGIYDHLGGGFHRYSTDQKWLVPHFEKMLYDNALLAWAYLEAYQVAQKEMYAEVARETLDYVLRDMQHPEGGFYSAEDADSEGEEGVFYVWREGELRELLTGEEFALIQKNLNITAKGNFENGTNILHWNPKQKWSVRSTESFKALRQKLFQLREQRVHPHKDDKILTDWNGLMIGALAKGAQVLGDERYRLAAQRAALFIKQHLVVGDQLKRRYRAGEARFSGTLSDYSYLIFGLLALYQTDFNPEWVQWAQGLQNTQDALFWDQEQGGYFFAAQGVDDLFVRQKEVNDGAIPSAIAVAVGNLHKLSALTLQSEYSLRAEQTLKFISPYMEHYPIGYAMSLIALDEYLDRSLEVAVIGGSDFAHHELRQHLYQQFLPHVTFAIRDGASTNYDIALLRGKLPLENKTTVYICEQYLCERPTTDMEDVKKRLAFIKKYSL